MIDYLDKKTFDKIYINNDKHVVHCPTLEFAEKFLAVAEKFGYKWMGVYKYSEKNNYSIYGSKTCYRIGRGTYGNIDTYNDDCGMKKVIITLTENDFKIITNERR